MGEWANKDRKKGGLAPMAIPMISDSYGCLCDDGVALRATYIIDGTGVLRHMSINDLPVGRNVGECIRLVQAFQHTDKFGEVCPASWKPGAKTMKPSHDEKLTKDYFEGQ